MRRHVICLTASLTLGGFPSIGVAQVINGEGTYEGSTLHTPPPSVEADRDPKESRPRETEPQQVERK